MPSKPSIKHEIVEAVLHCIESLIQGMLVLLCLKGHGAERLREAEGQRL